MINIVEQATSISPPVTATAGLPVVVGTAPVNLSKLDTAPVNVPVLCYTLEEAVKAFGYSDDWDKYTLCEFMYSQFQLFKVAPVVLINVLDPAVHKTAVTDQNITITAKSGQINEEGILLDTVVIKATGESGATYTKDTDYTIAFDSNGKVVINIKTGGSIPSDTTALKASYSKLDASTVDADDIIGGIDVSTGAAEGLELIDQVFPRFRLVPGIILVPGWSSDSSVAAVMDAKASNINQNFKAISITDIPTDTVKAYTAAPGWKNTNNINHVQQLLCWPRVKLGDRQFNLSTQLAGVICTVDAASENIPFASPSNNSLQIDAAVLEDGTEIYMGPDQVAYINSQGIVTALNFIGGWKAKGNRTSIYPGNTDPKDAFIPIRRMFNWISNTIVLSMWSKLDGAITRRMIDSVLDEVNIWMNGLTAAGKILGGRVEFITQENSSTNLMDGKLKFHLYVTPPPPAEELDWIVEYDPQYLTTLFA